MSRPAQPGRSRLPGKTAVVTGAARGIGAALALGLARRGVQVALIGLEPAELEATAAECAQHAPARAWTADVTDRARMRVVAAEVAGHFQRVDVVVANAGIAIGGPFAESDPAAFDRVIEVNLLGSAATARAFLPALMAADGYFLQVASLAAMTPAPLMAAYCASKAGVEAFAHALRAEVAHHGVDVGIAYLTWTDTDMVRAADADEPLRQLRARLPWPAGHTAPLDPAVQRILAGISARSAHVYAQRWIRGLHWLPRAALPTVMGRFGPGEVARLDGALRSTAGRRRQPLGPGGQAAFVPDQTGSAGRTD
jgi:NAD(P)-dependent dehydrogenase (short-subunit alcohol dehydrogenase family)